MAVESVVVDTDVFIWLTRGKADRVAKYAPHVEGKRMVLSFTTVAELWRGAVEKGYSEASRTKLEADIGVALVVQPTIDLVKEWAGLSSEAKGMGHALGQRAQAHDAWVAAIGRLFEIPILTEDSDFQGFPGLKLTLP